MAFNASTQMFVVHELEGWPENRERALLRRLFYRGANALSSQCLTSGGLRIKGGSASAVVQAHTAVYAVAKGILVTKAADTDMAALSGTVTNAKFNVFCHYVDAAGTLTTSMGQEAATLAGVVFPPTTEGLAMIGFTVINPTGTGNFVGGTTALDDATVVPNAAFVNTQGAFDPNFIFSF
jgi:hypothetical protein